MNRKLVLLLLVAAFATGAHAQTIDTVPSWNGSDYLSPWGPGGNTSTYGQTFTAPITGQLDSFDFYMENLGSEIDYTFSVMEWDGTKATRATLYDSGVQTLAANTVNAGFQKLSFSPMASVLSGTTYVAFLTTLGVTQTGSTSYGVQGSTSSDAYAGETGSGSTPAR